jgi:MoaA/NifB/PqqE/SkfB family radical SAM enzyme
LITNGTLLTPQRSRALISAGLDLLWVSLDGARPESYADVRLGAELPQVLKNIDDFRAARRASHRPTPEIGIAFVAMRRNIADLPELLRLSTRLGAAYYLVTNVLPYTREMCDEVLYSRALTEITYIPSRWVPHLEMPRMDATDETREVHYAILRAAYNLSYNGDNLGRANDRCPFIERGSTAIAWDGSLSPCLPLMHDHEGYLNRRLRRSRRYVVGNLVTHDLLDLWNHPDYVDFRQRVQAFDFAPCTVCGGCDLSEANEEDCYGNTFPTCGGCLWAQGVIQCP